MADLGAIAIDGSLETPGNPMLAVVAALPPLTMTISGVVTDDTDAEAARLVRVYLRSDGRFVGEATSDAVTGEYEVACPDEEVQRIALDDDAGVLYNDLIDRVIPG